jgi:hypothetical protein
MAYDAVLRNLAVIGEAVWALPGEFNAEGFYTPRTDASGPTPDRETLSTLRDRGAHRAWCGFRKTPQARSATAIPNNSSTTTSVTDPEGVTRLRGFRGRKGSLSVAPSSGPPTRSQPVVR